MQHVLQALRGMHTRMSTHLFTRTSMHTSVRSSLHAAIVTAGPAIYFPRRNNGLTHAYIGHNYIGHTYRGHTYRGHNYIGPLVYRATTI